MKQRFISKVIPNGKCSHNQKRLLISVPHSVAHMLNEFTGKQVKVTVEQI